VRTLRGLPAVIVIETSRALHVIPLQARDEIVRDLERAAGSNPDVAERARGLAERLSELSEWQAIPIINLGDARALVEAMEYRSIWEDDYPDVAALKRAVQEIIRDADA
jgi:hypothetical protein